VYRRGDGRFWFDAPVNPGFDADIVFRDAYLSMRDSTTGVFGSFAGNDTTGYLYSGSVRSESTAGSSFHLRFVRQTVGQNRGYGQRRNLGGRLITGRDSLAGKEHTTFAGRGGGNPAI
jgi:hypothetical protein